MASANRNEAFFLVYGVRTRSDEHRCDALPANASGHQPPLVALAGTSLTRMREHRLVNSYAVLNLYDGIFSARTAFVFGPAVI